MTTEEKKGYLSLKFFKNAPPDHYIPEHGFGSKEWIIATVNKAVEVTPEQVHAARHEIIVATGKKGATPDLDAALANLTDEIIVRDAFMTDHPLLHEVAHQLCCGAWSYVGKELSERDREVLARQRKVFDMIFGHPLLKKYLACGWYFDKRSKTPLGRMVDARDVEDLQGLFEKQWFYSSLQKILPEELLRTMIRKCKRTMLDDEMSWNSSHYDLSVMLAHGHKKRATGEIASMIFFRTAGTESTWKLIETIANEHGAEKNEGSKRPREEDGDNDEPEKKKQKQEDDIDIKTAQSPSKEEGGKRNRDEDESGPQKKLKINV